MDSSNRKLKSDDSSHSSPSSFTAGNHGTDNPVLGRNISNSEVFFHMGDDDDCEGKLNAGEVGDKEPDNFFAPIANMVEKSQEEKKSPLQEAAVEEAAKMTALGKMGVEIEQKFVPLKPENFTIYVKPLPITSLVFMGGGAKGAVYPPALIALEKIGMLKEIDTVGGSSAGAIIAMMTAIGMSGIEIEQKSNENSFAELLNGDRKKWSRDGIYEGKKLLDTLRITVINKMLAHVNDAQAILEEKINTITAEDYTILNNLKEKLTNANKDPKDENLEKYPITFGDLSSFKRIYDSISETKNKVKDLMVTGTNVTDVTLDIFSSRDKNCGDMEIALAVRISAGFPVLFQLVLFNGKLYTDGGLLNNLPLECFYKYYSDTNLEFLSYEQSRQKTLSFMLDAENANKVLHGKREKTKTGYLYSIEAILKTKICNSINPVVHESELMERLYDDGLMIIALPTFGISTLTWKIPDDIKIKVNEGSMNAVTEYFDNRKGELTRYMENDLINCFMRLHVSQIDEELISRICYSIINVNPPETGWEPVHDYVSNTAEKARRLLTEKHKLADTIMRQISRIGDDIEQKDIEVLNDTLKQYFSKPGLNVDQSDKRFNQILAERLMSGKQQIILFLNKLSRCLAMDNNDDKLVISSLLDQLDYFRLIETKDLLIEIMNKTKGKFFQIEDNVNMISEIIHQIREASTLDELEKLQLRKKNEIYEPIGIGSDFSRKIDSILGKRNPPPKDRSNSRNNSRRHSWYVQSIQVLLKAATHSRQHSSSSAHRMRIENRQLQRKHAELQSDYARLQTDYERSQSENEILQNEITRLRNENTRLKEMYNEGMGRKTKKIGASSQLAKNRIQFPRAQSANCNSIIQKIKNSPSSKNREPSSTSKCTSSIAHSSERLMRSPRKGHLSHGSSPSINPSSSNGNRLPINSSRMSASHSPSPVSPLHLSSNSLSRSLQPSPNHSAVFGSRSPSPSVIRFSSSNRLLINSPHLSGSHSPVSPLHLDGNSLDRSFHFSPSHSAVSSSRSLFLLAPTTQIFGQPSMPASVSQQDNSPKNININGK